MLGAAHFSRRSGLCLLRHIFSGRSRAGSLCAACLAKPPAFTRARAILAYDEASGGAFLALKHADRLELVPGFARWLGRVGRSLLEDCDLIVLVPLHPARLWLRRYNQSAELARRGAGPGPQPPHPQPGRHAVGPGAAEKCPVRLQGSRAGAADITVLTLARVVKASEALI